MTTQLPPTYLYMLKEVDNEKRFKAQYGHLNTKIKLYEIFIIIIIANVTAINLIKNFLISLLFSFLSIALIIILF